MTRTEAAIVALGVALRLVGLTHGDLWHDEAFTALVSPLPWARFWEALLGDVHPPAWYLVSRLSLAILGRSVFALRLPAALFSIAALLLFWRAARTIESGAARSALALMAVNPFQIYYAQEARMYAALTLACLAMLYGVVEDRRWWFAAGAVGALWLHNLGAVYVLAGLVALLLHRVRDPASLLGVTLDWWWPVLLVAFAGAPALIWTVYQAFQVAPGYWIIDRSVGSWLYHAFFCQLFGGGMMDSRLAWNGAAAASLLAFGGLAAAVKARRWAWAASGWVPGLVMLATSALIRPMLLARTLIGTGPGLYLMAGQLWTSRRRAWALWLAIIPLFASGLATHYLTPRRGDVAELVRQISVQEPAAVLHSQTGAWILLAWQVPELDHYVWTGGAHGLSNAVSDRTAAALGMERAALDDLPRPVGVIYADYALVSPEERASILAELDAAGAELVYTAADDPVQRIDLWMVR